MQAVPTRRALTRKLSSRPACKREVTYNPHCSVGVVFLTGRPLALWATEALPAQNFKCQGTALKRLPHAPSWHRREACVSPTTAA